ncbi:hypothetical protein HMPREF1579_01341, partial [Gardnerella vaginalis JCP8066]
VRDLGRIWYKVRSCFPLFVVQHAVNRYKVRQLFPKMLFKMPDMYPISLTVQKKGVYIIGCLGPDTTNGLAVSNYYTEEQRLIFAYSPSYASGSVSEKGMQSAAAQRYIAFHEAGKAQWQGILDEAKQPSSGVSGIPGAVGGVSKVSSDPKDVFAKYADRLESLAGALNDSQKATLGMMYKLAS